jgi:KDO2-lipid IV(A) lauroyltransferase
LPFPLIYIGADILYLFLRFVLRYRRETVRRNLTESFPERGHKEIATLEKAFYRNLADVVLESFKGHAMTEAQIRLRVALVNPQLLDDRVKDKQSIMILGAHQANWEWLVLGLGCQLPMPLDAVYRPLHNKAAEQFVLETRSHFGARPVAAADTMQSIVRRRRELRALGIIADQAPRMSDEHYWTTFLGRESAFFLGPDRIAKLTKYPVYFADLKRVRRGFYEIELHLLAEAPYKKEGQDIMDKYLAFVERQILEHPSEWLWSHRRWKRKRPTPRSE